MEFAPEEWVAPEEWIASQGALPNWDSYFLPFFDIAWVAFIDNQAATEGHTAELLQHNLVWMNTFITDARYDIQVSAENFPNALMLFETNDKSETLIRNVVFDHEPRAGIARPGWIDVTYTAAEGTNEETVRTIRAPEYLDSGHLVTLSQSRDLQEDIVAFLEETGAYD
jgi:hypothetical protein